MACYDRAVQVRSCYLNNLREKVDHNFDNALITFGKTKYKILVAVKEKDLCLTRSELMRNAFFMDPLKAVVMKLVL